MGSIEAQPGAPADDHDLLREYGERDSEDAFRTLVERHSGLVYGAARRLVGDAHAAAEITQSVFLALARKSSSLPRAVPLAGWLHTAARYAASHWRRSEARRRERERAAPAGHVHGVNDDTERAWDEIAPSLDAALASLNPCDREAVLLRFFEQRSFGEVAAGLGTTEDAAKMRVSRAVRRLRTFLQRRGATVNAVALTTCLAGHAAATAPAHVVTAAAQLGAGGAVHASGIAALTVAIGEAMRWARFTRILLTTAAVVVLVASVGFSLMALTTGRSANETAPATADLTVPGAAESLLRESTVILGEWQATPAGLVIGDIPWSHLAIPGPFAGDYRLQIAFTQDNADGVVELLLPAGPQMLLILLRPPAVVGPDAATQALDAALGPRPPGAGITHLAEVDVRTRAGEISLSVNLDGEAIAGTNDVPAALQRATMVPDQPRGMLGLGASRTGAVFTHIEVQALPHRP